MKLFDRQIYSTVIAQFSLQTPSAETALTGKVSIQLNPQVPVPANISEVSKRILEDLSQNEGFLEENDTWCRTITIQNYNPDTGDIEYSCGEEDKQLSGATIHPLNDLIQIEDIKAFSLYPIKAKAEPITFCDHLFQILNDNPWLYFPVVGWLTALLWALIASPTPKEFLSPDEIADLNNCSSPEAFYRFMTILSDDASKQLQSSGEEYKVALATLRDQAAQCAERGQAIVDALKKNPEAPTFQSLAEQYTSEIFEHLETFLFNPQIDSLFEKIESGLPLTDEEEALCNTIEGLLKTSQEDLLQLLTDREKALWESRGDITRAQDCDRELFSVAAKLAFAAHHQEQKGLDPTQIATIPMGYYRDGIYQPILLTFCIRDGQLNAHTINLDPTLGKKVIPLQQYSLNDGTENLEQSKERLAHCLTTLFQFMEKPEHIGLVQKQVSKALKATNALAFADKGGAQRLVNARADYEAALTIQQYLDTHPEEPPSFEDTYTYSYRYEFLANPIMQEATNRLYIFGDSRKEIQIGLNVNAYRERLLRLEHQHGTPMEDSASLQAEEEIDTLYDMPQLIDLLLKNSGLDVVEAAPAMQKLISTSEDWSKSVWFWMHKNYPSLSSSKKLNWETNILFNYVDSFLESLRGRSNVSLEQQSRHLRDIETMIHRLEKKYRKEFGGQEAFIKVWEGNLNFKSVFDQLRDKISAHKGLLASSRIESLNAATAASSVWRTTVDKESGATESEAITAHRPVLLEAREILQEMEDCVQQVSETSDEEQASAFLDLLQNYTSSCTHLFDHNFYGELVDAVAAGLEKIPLPDHPLWGALPAERIDDAGEVIAKLTQYVWEAHIKLNRTFVWPHQAMHLMKCRAVFDRLMKIQAENARKEFCERFFSLSETEQDQLIEQAMGFSQGYRYTFSFDESKTFFESLNESGEIDKCTSYLYLIGYIAKELGMSRQMTLPFVFSDLTTDASQLNFLLQDHPYLRFGNDPEEEVRALEMQRYNKISIHKYSDHRLFLDSFRFDDRDGDSRFLLQFRDLLCCFLREEVNYDLAFKAWRGSLSRDQQDLDDFLPKLAIDLRRHNLFTQCLLHPESTLVKGFEGNFQKANWALDLTNQVLEEDDQLSSEQIFQRGAEIEQQQRHQLISQMGHLELVSGKGAEGGGTCIHITDEQGTERFEYQPTGPRFVDIRNPHHDACVVGKVSTLPQTFVTSEAGEWDFNDFQTVKAKRERDQQVVFPLTEVSALVEEKNDPSTSLSLAANAKLRSLVVSRSED